MLFLTIIIIHLQAKRPVIKAKIKPVEMQKHSQQQRRNTSNGNTKRSHQQRRNKPCWLGSSNQLPPLVLMTTSGLIQGIDERANTGLGEQSREVEVQRNVVLLKDSL